MNIHSFTDKILKLDSFQTNDFLNKYIDSPELEEVINYLESGKNYEINYETDEIIGSLVIYFNLLNTENGEKTIIFEFNTTL